MTFQLPQTLHVVTVAWRDGSTDEFRFGNLESAIAYRNRKRKDPSARTIALASVNSATLQIAVDKG